MRLNKTALDWYSEKPTRTRKLDLLQHYALNALKKINSQPIEIREAAYEHLTNLKDFPKFQTKVNRYRRPPTPREEYIHLSSDSYLLIEKNPYGFGPVKWDKLIEAATTYVFRAESPNLSTEDLEEARNLLYRLQVLHAQGEGIVSHYIEQSLQELTSKKGG